MRKSIFFAALIWLSSSIIFGQNLEKNSKKNKLQFAIGNSLTYIWQSETFYGKSRTTFREFTWNTNVSFSYFDRFWLGFQVMPIFTKQVYYLPEKNENYMIYGGFFQYDFFRKDNWKMFGETSLNYGDYCNCGPDYYPHRQEGLYYLGLGGGGIVPLNALSKHLFMELSFFNYFILNDVALRDNYTQYIIGLNYLFGNLR